ncbi:hypothetical protein [Massilia sp. TN1-12]|uniref:hypothetical protein n=1 Tax=Massilia paldalensis TaxID=3377675 RepID=UPI00384FE9BC
MISTASNVLLEAFSHNAFEKFLVGEPPYFFHAKNDNEEPQNVSQAFYTLIIPYWNLTKDIDFPKRFSSALYQLLDTYPDKNRAIYVAHEWIWCYKYFFDKNILNSSEYYRELFEVDLSQVAYLLKSLIEENKEGLINDHRWAGRSWNSQNGMWGPLLKVSETVRDKLGGPNFVPTNK